MFERFTEPARRSIFFARHEAAVAGSPGIEPPHLLMGLLREIPSLATRIGALDALRTELIPPPSQPQSASVDLPMSAECRFALEFAAEEATQHGHALVTPQHLLLGLLRTSSKVSTALESRGISAQGIRGELAAEPALQGEPPPTRAGMHAMIDDLPDAMLGPATAMLRHMQGAALHRMPPGFRGTGVGSGGGLGGSIARPPGTPPEGRFSSSHNDPDGTVVVESRHFHHGHEIVVRESIRLDAATRTLSYTHEVRGPGGEQQRHSADFEVPERDPA